METKFEQIIAEQKEERDSLPLAERRRRIAM